MIYGIPSQQRMKNKLDFPTPFPDEPFSPAAASPPFITPASLPANTSGNSTTEKRVGGQGWRAGGGPGGGAAEQSVCSFYRVFLVEKSH